MTSAVERLMSLVDADDRYDIPLSDLISTQMEAASERLASRLGMIRLLGHRVESAGNDIVRNPSDLVPLLFAHTTYKSYPEAWLTEGKWDRLGKWLDALSAYRIERIEASNISDIDSWLEKLAEQGHFVSCSSGTSGKCAMIDASATDRSISKRCTVASMKWATGLSTDRDRKYFSVFPRGNNFRNNDTIHALMGAYAAPNSGHEFPHDPITIGQVTRMVALRRGVADGTARPSEVASYNSVSAARAKAMDEAVLKLAETVVASRSQKLLLNGQFALMFRLSEIVREMGFAATDFHPDNAWMVGGGLKGADLPPDYRERILATFNIKPEHVYEMYGMQELNTHLPRCRGGRFHVAPWLILLPLDQAGEQLLDPKEDEMECRAAFFDLSVDGRWGGIITGDRINVDYGPCACGRPGPTISSDIARFADLEGGDKISCSGTIDAYIRGVA